MNEPHSRNSAPSLSADVDGRSAAWERRTLEKLAFSALAEQRSRRRWGIFFRLLAFAYITFLLVLYLGVDWFSPDKAHRAKHTAVVQLNGLISSKSEASAENIIPALQAAFEDKNTAGVILRINSPGGSAVQAGIIHDEIIRLQKKNPDIRIYAVVEDICASGGYYVAAATEKIYVDKASLVGSIGVLLNGFGFTGTMEKLGVDRRLLTAGENKGFLDPFSPAVPEQEEHAKVLLDEIHQQFIAVVREGRGERLQDSPEIFSGLIWTGSQSIKLGLADDFGSVESVARDVVQAEKTLDYTVKDSLAERLAKRLGASAVSGVVSGLDESAGVTIR